MITTIIKASTKRDPGFYWVLINTEWVIAEYTKRNGFWFIMGVDDYFSDSYFKEIDERRIERQI